MFHVSIDREKLKSIIVGATLLGFAYLAVTVGPSGLVGLFVRASIGGENIDRAQATAHELNARIASELREGASTDEIEDFLTRHGVVFGYDRFQSQYQGLVRISEFAVVNVYLNVDRDKKFVSGEAQVTLTSL
jgi:hypothetical protein